MDIPSFVITGLIGLAGVAAGYGALKITSARNASDIQDVRSTFVPQRECTLKHQQLVSKIDKIELAIIDQQRTTRRLGNFAIHQLTTLCGMSLAEAQDILENGKD